MRILLCALFGHKDRHMFEKQGHLFHMAIDGKQYKVLVCKRCSSLYLGGE